MAKQSLGMGARLVHRQLDRLDGPKGGEDLFDVILCNIPRQVTHMKPRGNWTGGAAICLWNSGKHFKLCEFNPVILRVVSSHYG